MEEQENEIFVDNSEKDDFIFHTQKFCWFNWEIGIQNPNLTEEERLNLISCALENEGLEFAPGELEEVIPHAWLSEILDSYDTGKNPIGWHLTDKSLADVVVKVDYKITRDSAHELVKNGEADLLWDSEKEDFVIRSKG